MAKKLIFLEITLDFDISHQNAHFGWVGQFPGCSIRKGPKYLKRVGENSRGLVTKVRNWGKLKKVKKFAQNTILQYVEQT